MTTSTAQHAVVIAGIAEQLRDVLDGSTQGMYVYLDDQHKLCNARFAGMLGYDSPSDWDRAVSFTDQYVEVASQRTLVTAYRRAMQEQAGSTIDVTWKRADGVTVPTTVILVPVAYGGELLGLHFVTPK